MKNNEFLMILFGGGIFFFVLTIVIHIILNISNPSFSQSLMNIPINDAFWYSFGIFILALLGFVIKENLKS